MSKVKAKRTTFGPASNALDMAIDAGLLPREFKDYRQRFLASWDIETLEVETDLTSIQQAVHKVVSIAIASNLPNQTDKFFVRDSSKAEDGQKLVDDFLDEVFRLEACYNKFIPNEIKQANCVIYILICFHLKLFASSYNFCFNDGNLASITSETTL